MLSLNNVSVIAAVRGSDEFRAALDLGCSVIFDLSPDLFSVASRVREAHEKGAKLFMHFDLASGIGKDMQGIRFVKGAGVDGIISTKTNIIKLAREAGLFTVQRFFIVDSHSIHTTIESVKASKADMIEIMPGLLTKVIVALREKVSVPIIAGGLVETKTELEEILRSGAAAVSTGKKELWGGKI